ncbi:MAG: Asp23/Gls24 family envelope stress response protein, partial [Lachnospiraceae bacterium]|nr:Asp23/Gls24 family envelope stress response protein [Lachnospiraceae bacterium]
MSIERSTKLGAINISDDAVATLCGSIVAECYGVVGMASKNLLKDGFAELLKKENYARGIVVRREDDVCELDLYIIISYGIKISEVVQ